MKWYLIVFFIYISLIPWLGFPGGSGGKEPVCQCRRHRGLGSIPGLGRSLEKGMATHAWRIPWTEEPGGLQSIGSQRVGHDWSDLASKFDFNYKCYRLFYGKFIINLTKRPKYLHLQRLKSCDLFGCCFSFYHFYKHYHCKKSSNCSRVNQFPRKSLFWWYKYQ